MPSLVDQLLAEGEANDGKFSNEPTSSPIPQVEEVNEVVETTDFNEDINLDFTGNTQEMSPVADDFNVDFEPVETPTAEPVVDTPQPVVETPVQPIEPVVETPIAEPMPQPVVEVAPVPQPVVETPVEPVPPVVEPVVEAPIPQPVAPQPVVETVVEPPQFIKNDVEVLENDNTFNNAFTPTNDFKENDMAQMKWTEEEDEIIRQHINRAPKKLQELLPNRTTSSIAQRKAKIKKSMNEEKPKERVRKTTPTPAPAPVVVETPAPAAFSITGDLEGDLFALASRTILKDIAKSHKSNIVTTESLREMVTSYVAGKDASFKNWKSVFESVLTEIIDSGYKHSHYGDLTQLVLESVIDELQD